MADKKYNVLFLCTGNSARSILAEAIMNNFGQGKFVAYSAGSHPNGTVNPNSISLLESLNIDTAFARSKDWNEFAGEGAPKLDFVFTVCDDAAGEVCPFWPGQPMSAHWGLPDPASVTGNPSEIAFAFSETYRMLKNRITAFANLPISSLDKISLQAKMDKIGKE